MLFHLSNLGQHAIQRSTRIGLESAQSSFLCGKSGGQGISLDYRRGGPTAIAIGRMRHVNRGTFQPRKGRQSVAQRGSAGGKCRIRLSPGRGGTKRTGATTRSADSLVATQTASP